MPTSCYKAEKMFDRIAGASSMGDAAWLVLDRVASDYRTLQS
jgi:hypothetical protein